MPARGAPRKVVIALAKKRPNGTGTLRRRKNGLWELTFLIGYDEETGKRKYKSVYARTQSEALRKGESFLAEQRKGVLDDHDYTVAEWGAWFLEHHAEFAKLADSTADSYRWTMKLIARYLGRKAMKNLKAYDVERFLLDLQRAGYGASTISKARGFLFQMCKAAVANDIIVKNVVAYVEKMRYEKAAPKESFTSEEIQKMMRELPQDKISWSIRILLMTGLRKQELLALEPHHIAEDGSSISVEQAVSRKRGTAYISKTKTSSSVRVVPVPEQARAYAILLRNSCTGTLIWESPRKAGSPVNPSYFDDLYYAALDSIRVRRLSPHSCRHTYVSQLQAKGVPMETIRTLVGHTEVLMTQKYLHVQEPVKIEAANQLNALCQGHEEAE